MEKASRPKILQPLQIDKSPLDYSNLFSPANGTGSMFDNLSSLPSVNRTTALSQAHRNGGGILPSSAVLTPISQRN